MKNILLAGIFLLFTISNAKAWDLEPRVELGAQMLTYSDESDSDAALGGKIVLGDKRYPIYFWGSYDAPEGNILAQSVTDLGVTGIGIGFEYKLDKDISVFFEGGYGNIDSSVDQTILDEMVYTVIVADWTPEELDASDINCAYNNAAVDRECYQGSVDVKSAPMARIGIAYQVWEHVRVSAAYRYLRSDYDLTITDAGNLSGNTGTSYSDSVDLNLDAFELGLLFTW